MTKEELAKEIGISRPTLNLWEKEKPRLVELINKGFLFEQWLEEEKDRQKRINLFEKKAKNKKFNYKDFPNKNSTNS